MLVSKETTDVDGKVTYERSARRETYVEYIGLLSVERQVDLFME